MVRHCLVLCSLLIAGLSSPVAFSNSDYRLGAGDEIRIQVYEENDLSMTLRLD